MRYKKTAKRVLCGLMAGVMILGNAMTGFAIDSTPPVNPDGTKPNGNKPQDTIQTENTYVNDTPLRLQVSKVKTAPGEHEGIAPKNTQDITEEDRKDTITYKISGRVDGKEADLIKKYGDANIELAYTENGVYLGYGWYRGTLEYLLNRQAQSGLNETLQIMYDAESGVFAGYAYVTRKLETADDVNRYVAGATMALYDAVEIFRDDSITNDGKDQAEDKRFKGVTVERDQGSNNVNNVYVNKGYAGTQIKYVLQEEDKDKLEIDEYGNIINQNYDYQDEINEKGKGTWIAKTVQRGDTPILYYSLDNLRITTNDTYASSATENNKEINATFFGKDKTQDSGKEIAYPRYGHIYGFDKSGNVVDITQKDETDFSIYAFKADDTGNKRPIYEFVGGNFDEIRYNLAEKRIVLGKDTVMYHLDADGNRDSMVDPQTGIAYIEEKITPTEGHDNIHQPNDTASTTNTKIYVWPVNITYDGSGSDSGNKNGSKTFRKMMSTRIATINADTEHEFTTGTMTSTKEQDQFGNWYYTSQQFSKEMNPVLDEYGHPIYYRKSNETYIKGQDTWDYDGEEYTGYQYTDKLDSENEDSYSVNNHNKLYNGDKDDPFDQSTHYQYFDVQSVKVTVDTDGNYIVNGKTTVPTPRRDGYVFEGWLVEPNRLHDGMTVKASWGNANSSLSQAQKDKWYSDKTAAGTTKTMTVKFDANGGEFRRGDGNIHSTDNVLYRRLGDGYIMENIWTTGENTPNDPFDTQKVDTVENTSAQQNTISQQNETGNDVYSKTNAGGQADMLKRVNAGLYIMEEVKAPLGFVKGLPVGVTMNENTDIQYAEMTDKTIKLELVKADAPSSRQVNLYIDGALQKNPDTTNVKVNEPIASYSYKHVPGAVLSVKGKDEASIKALHDWVKVTVNDQAASGNRIVKKTDANGNYYFEFTTTEPLFLEAFPKGTYVVHEEKTPAGFVTMEDQEFTVEESDEVHFIQMEDDHTKVEVEKYYNDGNGDKHLPNSYRATLSLNAQDGTKIASWQTDDLSDYTTAAAAAGKTGSKSGFAKAWGAITSLFAAGDNGQSFVGQFEELVRNGNTNFTSISWNAERVATLKSTSDEAGANKTEEWLISDGTRVTVTNGNVAESAPQSFKDAYNNNEIHTEGSEEFTYSEPMSATKDEANSPTLADMIWNVSNGTKIHIGIYPANDNNESGRKQYAVDFKFNYKNDYAGDYANTRSYDTIDGIHRFDYLPTGTYIIKEDKVPTGFVKAADITVTVKDTADVQRFRMKNVGKELTLAKYALDETGYYAGMQDNLPQVTQSISQAAILKGAKLALYYSDTKIPDFAALAKEALKENAVPAKIGAAVLKDNWTTGDDGSYSKADLSNEIITPDKLGDLRPHVYSEVENGFYYLVETETPDYYQTMEPVEIQVTDQTTSAELSVYGINKPMPLEVKVLKKNDHDSVLPGAVFLVKNKTLGIDQTTITTGNDGIGKANIGSIGKFGPDGSYVPYTFTIQETSAPAGYQLDPTVHEFTPDPKQHDAVTIMVNASDADIVDGTLHMVNEATSITISKSDFETYDPVPGTKISVRKAFKDTDGIWKKQSDDKENADWDWTVKDNEKTHALTGLVAEGTYVMYETEVPDGYTKASDIFFKVSANGGAIEKIWYSSTENPGIDFKADSTGAVESVTFETRKLASTYITLEDTAGGESVRLGIDSLNADANTGKRKVILTDKDVTDGHTYLLKEYIHYSDGTDRMLGSTTFTASNKYEEVKTEDGKVVATIKTRTIEIPVNNTAANIGYTVSDMADEAGTPIADFVSDKAGTNGFGSYTINNPTIGSGDSMTASAGRKNVDHKAVQAGDGVGYTITYKGAGKEIVLIPDSNLNYSQVGAMELGADGNYRFTTTEESGSVTVYAVVKNSASGYIDQQVTIDGAAYRYINPIAANSGEGSFKNSSKISISTDVEGNDPNNANALFTYKIKLTQANGSALPGAYDYRTKSTYGTLEAFGATNEFTVTVTGDDFIVISDLPYNTKYEVTQMVPANFDFAVVNTKSSGQTSNTGVSNVLFINTRNLSEDREVFKRNHSYVITEKLNFVTAKDGNKEYLTQAPLELSKYTFSLGEKCQVNNVGMLNKKTNVYIKKIDWATGRFLSGATLKLQDANGADVLDANGDPIIWKTTESEKAFVGVLEAGKIYQLVEVSAPAGYSKTAAITFTVSTDGSIDRIVMEDKAIGIQFSKTSIVDDGELPGAHVSLKVWNETNGNYDAVDDWVSTTEVHVIEKPLEVGKTYLYHEDYAPKGYAYSFDIRFRIDDNGNVQDAQYVGDNGSIMLLDKDGNVTSIERITTDGRDTYQYKGETVYLRDSNIVDKDNHVLAEGVTDKIEIVGNRLVMKDKPFEITFTKEDFAGNEVPGATCVLEKVTKDDNGNETVEEIAKWVSKENEKYVLGDQLEAGGTYRYHEELAPEGYGYSEDIEFSIDKNGNVINAHYVNEDKKPILYDKDGFPTDIVVNGDGTYSSGNLVITIDKNGNAVDENGEIHAEGVKYWIEVVDNQIKMKDAPTEMNLLKVNEDQPILGANGEVTGYQPIAGATFQIFTEDGAEVYAIKDTKIPSTEHEGNIKAGERIIFASDGSTSGINVTGQLKSGTHYVVRELSAPAGFITDAEVAFYIPYLNQKEPVRIVMKNRPTDIFFTKEDFAGEEVPGATVSLEKVNKDGTTTQVGDAWISSTETHEIKGQLETNTTYRYHEEFAPDGYGYSEDIEFTINSQGKVTEAHYINKEGKPILYDKNGFPTDIVVNGDGSYQLGEEKITIDTDGNAVKEDGTIVAEGVQFEIEIVDNVIRMKDAPTKAKIVKYDKKDQPLAGARLQIIQKDENGTVTETVAISDTLIPSTEHEGMIKASEKLIFDSTKEGVIYTKQLKAGETYYLRELAAPKGYYVSDDVQFTVPYYNTNETLIVRMEDKPTELHFSKTSFTSTEEVVGATCYLTDEYGNILVDAFGNEVRWISTTEPKVLVGVLEPGKTYHYHEELAPDGYGYSEDVIFTVNEDGTIQKVVMKDKPTEVLINKYAETKDSETPVPVAGAKLQIMNLDGTPVKAPRDSKADEGGTIQFKKGNELVFTSTETGVNITGMLNADTTYLLRELEAAPGYLVADDVTFTTSHDGSLIRVNMYDPPTRAKLIKVDNNGEGVKGAQLEVRAADNWDLYDYWTSDGNPRDITGVLSTDKLYKLVETQAPDGYYRSKPVEFTISKTDKVTEVKMTDEPIVIKLIKLKAGTDEKLSGGTFEILRKSDGSVVIPEFTLDGELTIEKQLKAGETYLFHEVSAPSGYRKASDVEFTIPFEKTQDVIVVTMEDTKIPTGGGGNHGGGGGGGTSTPPTLTFKKYDGLTMQALPGAEFTIYDADGRVYKTVTTDQNGYARVTFSQLGKYSYKETKAPAGYEIDDTKHEFEITKSSYLTQNVANYTTPPDVEVVKKDAETGEVIQGVTFEITNEAGQVVYKGTTDRYGMVKFSPSEYGNYAVRETKVPNGYEKSDGYITFKVTAGGIEGDTTFFNNKVTPPGPTPPGTPPDNTPPVDNPSKGHIDAKYDGNTKGGGEGWFDRDGNWHPFATPSKTGDYFPFVILFAMMGIGCAGLMVMRKERRHEKK